MSSISSANDSVPRREDQSEVICTLQTTKGMDNNELTLGDATSTQGTHQPHTSPLDDTDRSMGVMVGEESHTNGLHLRHRREVEQEHRAAGTATVNGSGDSSKFQAMHMINGSDNTGTEIASVDTAWSESTIVPRRNLGFIQITSLMLNATSGSGIFITPGYVLALTRSKSIALVLWALGGIYTALRYVVLGAHEICS